VESGEWKQERMVGWLAGLRESNRTGSRYQVPAEATVASGGWVGVSACHHCQPSSLVGCDSLGERRSGSTRARELRVGSLGPRAVRHSGRQRGPNGTRPTGGPRQPARRPGTHHTRFHPQPHLPLYHVGLLRTIQVPPKAHDCNAFAAEQPLLRSDITDNERRWARPAHR
jgi:hypothetical protein